VSRKITVTEGKNRLDTLTVNSVVKMYSKNLKLHRDSVTNIIPIAFI